MRKTYTIGIYTNNLIDKDERWYLWTYIFKINNLYYTKTKYSNDPRGECGVFKNNIYK